tara:strand:+ start:267 stop:548 length:282 start_codon:yes stop_codon:yes gene_type:complete
METSPRDRLVLLMEHERLTTNWLEENTGIPRDRWRNCKSGATKMRSEETEALCKLFPEYTFWIAMGEEKPEFGQISPMTNKAQKTLKPTPKAG